jgi:hypothetical protein
MQIDYLILKLNVIFSAVLYKYIDAFQQAFFWLEKQIQDSQQKNQTGS